MRQKVYVVFVLPLEIMVADVREVLQFVRESFRPRR